MSYEGGRFHPPTQVFMNFDARVLLESLAARGIDVVLLRGYEGLPRDYGGDLDLGIRPTQLNAAIDFLEQFSLENDLTLVRVIRRPHVVAWRAIRYTSPGVVERLYVDLQAHPGSWMGVDYLPVEDVIAASTREEHFLVPTPLHELALRTLTPALIGGALPRRISVRGEPPGERIWQEFFGFLSTEFGHAPAAGFISALRSGDSVRLRREARRMRMHLISRACMREGFTRTGVALAATLWAEAAHYAAVRGRRIVTEADNCNALVDFVGHSLGHIFKKIVCRPDARCRRLSGVRDAVSLARDRLVIHVKTPRARPPEGDEVGGSRLTLEIIESLLLADSAASTRWWMRWRVPAPQRRWIQSRLLAGARSHVDVPLLQGHARSMIVLVAGPDGSGKSSVNRRLGEEWTPWVSRLHWRPFLLPAPKRASAADITRPHAHAPDGRLLSALRLGYIWTDFLVFGLFARLRCRCWLMERGWWDMVVDPYRYRLRLPHRLILAFGHLVPRPDVVIVLDAPAHVLYSRKQELPTEELERQRRAWLELEVPGAEKVILDATQPLDQVVAEARKTIVAHLERRAVARLGAGWANLPSRTSIRWWLPRGPRATAVTGIRVYQPVTAKGRAGWEVARFLARAGGFRLVPRGGAPPREVRARLAEHLPPRTTYAVMRANHPGRYVALIVGEDGAARAVAKVATTPEGEERLCQEARAIERWGPLLRSAVRAPRVIGEGEGVLVLEAVPFRPRRRPWLLDPTVAAALGALEREGVSHGDAAPWNLLETPDGFVLVDWESAGPVPGSGWDLWHWLVQSHALLGRPRVREVVHATRGEGRLGSVVRAFAEAAGLEQEDLTRFLRSYLERTLTAVGMDGPEGARRLRLLEALAA